ncbi:TetR/AcrR family transcriptional regulator [Planomonospora parontospora]|uniref:TetR/AcrR family transcriptional regulator n=1 Tax=Planomonospora parontospora TaxID=58119 RepID=UPI00167183FA|nr:TetR family transcriptional regulator [Planomonospora parontospora]GGL40467.1 TetR family transcriptional regulator [Planomonospora parontospora subsp. antibiotica]GII18268.1 TetR family transcriptional regulator [Planomonospora parontospora subsp. antibiotica]
MTTTPADDEESILTLLWSPPPPPRFGPQPSLTRAALAAAAVHIADAEGLHAVSMQRVATALGVTKNALYRYVRSKAELIALTIEHAVEDPPDLSPIPDWRLRVEQWADDLHAVWQRHPWLSAATIGDRPMGPHEVGWIETALAAIGPSGLPVTQRLDVVLAMFALVRSAAVTGTGTQPWTLPGDTGQRLLARLREHPAQYPALLRASATFADDGNSHPHATSAAGAQPAATPVNSGWRTGLRLLLDGLEASAAPRR